MTHPSAVGGVFHRPFTEQVAFFRRKLGRLVPTQAWDDMLGAAHDDAFMVAGATEADLLTDLAAAVDKAIAEGKGIDDFRRDFRAIVARHGWTGWTGEGSVKGEAWRVKTILRTNSYTSYAAGRMAQLRAGNFKFWVYRHGGSLEPRPEHLSWDGLALAPDNIFWDTHYPPSDWGCSCYVVGARTEAAIKRLGGDPDKTLPADWNAIDAKTGAPVGIGRGWDYAPGASVSSVVQAMAKKIGNWDFGVARVFMGGLPVADQDALSNAYRSLPSTGADARRMAASIFEQRNDPAAKSFQSLGMMSDVQQQDVARKIGKSVERSDFRLSSDFATHVRAHHTNAKIEASRRQRVVTPDDFALIPQILSAPDAIDPAGVSDAGETVVMYKKVIGPDTYNLLVVVNRTHNAMILKTMYIGI